MEARLLLLPDLAGVLLFVQTTEKKTDHLKILLSRSVKKYLFFQNFSAMFSPKKLG